MVGSALNVVVPGISFLETPASINMAPTQPITSFFQPIKIKQSEKAEAMECDAQ